MTNGIARWRASQTEVTGQGGEIPLWNQQPNVYIQSEGIDTEFVPY